MDPFSPQQPDEGYSEDPLNPTSLSAFAVKPHDDHTSALLASRSGGELPPWLLRHISAMSISNKTQLTISLLDELPTSVIAEIVQQLNPRLYIDFIRYLPAEICLKILGYLDPVSLVSVAQSCRAWYDLALDRKLWEKLYYLEGWKAVPSEIQLWEDRVNERLSSPPGQVERLVSVDGGHAHKKRAISFLRVDGDHDHVMLDADRSMKEEPKGDNGSTSLFGGPGPAAPNSARSSVTPGIGDLNMDGSGSSWSGGRMDSKGAAVERNEGRPSSASSSSSHSSELDLINPDSLPSIFSPAGSRTVPRSTLWMWDNTSNKYRINWKYLYTLRRRLEANWELGKFTNFQFPHPLHPEEGHGECIYSIQFNSEYLVSGSRDRTLRIWNMRTRRLVRNPLSGHRGSVLCLQFDSDPDEDLIVSGSSDSDVILWRFSTGQIIQRLSHAHRESVLNVKFDKRILVTCSKDKTIKIFNRRELKAGDLGYGEVPVHPVPIHLKDYGYDGLDQLPVKPPYTLIGSLEGHGAAVNAVQICGREVVSASGDRNVKIWDWPNQTCLRTFLGHNKGIACVQYDGRRIVSGSSDNEVKVFDRQSGVEVASLRSHSNLVRTVQAGFGDLPYSAIEDEKEAAMVDQQYFEAVQSGILPANTTSRISRRNRTHYANAGSRRPEHIIATGAKLPPGGGGGKYGRIVSGSYDTTIIIWRRDKEGIWKAQHILKQEEAAAAASQRRLVLDRPSGPPAPDRPQDLSREHQADPAQMDTAPPPAGMAASSSAVPPPPTQGNVNANAHAHAHALPPMDTTPGSQIPYGDTTPNLGIPGPSASSHAPLARLIDEFVDQGVHMLQQALTTYPAMLAMQSHLQAAIDKQTSPFVRSQMRQAVSTALVRTQIAQARARALPTVTPPAANAGGSSSAAAAGPSNWAVPSYHHAVEAGNSRSASSSPQGGPRSIPTSHPQPQHPVVAAATAAATGAGPSGTAGSAHDAMDTTGADNNTAPPPPQAHAPPQPTAATVTGAPPPAVVPAAAAARQVAHHPHVAGADAVNLARVFKLQFDARRLICCSQTSVIVGWDFCAGDKELEAAARFFGTVE